MACQYNCAMSWPISVIFAPLELSVSIELSQSQAGGNGTFHQRTEASKSSKTGQTGHTGMLLLTYTFYCKLLGNQCILEIQD